MSATLADVEAYAASYFEILSEQRSEGVFYGWLTTAMARPGNTPGLLGEDEGVLKFHTSEAARMNALHFMKKWQRGVLWRQAEEMAREYVHQSAARRINSDI